MSKKAAPRAVVDKEDDKTALQKPKKQPSNNKKIASYTRGSPISLKGITDKKLRTILTKKEKASQNAAIKAAQNEMLLQEQKGFLEAEGMERTYKFTQEAIIENVDISSAKKSFSLKLDELGPYCIDYARNGRRLLIGGRKGHVATFDWRTSKLGCEIQVKEAVRDVQWLHNETMFAVAQKKYTYIYDQTGLEVHYLKSHIDVHRLQFLPYHFLLASIGEAGYLKYQDTSTGQLVAEHRTKLGACHAMRQNPFNAIMHCGHQNGTVTLWSPSMTTPLVKMLCHKGPVQALAMDLSGLYMVTSGLDSQLKVWDIRTYKPVHAYYTTTPASSLDISQLGLLAVGFGPHAQVWKDALKSKADAPYLNHLNGGTTLRDLAFCPFEDVLGLGHSKGFTSILVPGSGEPNIDALEANPFATKKQRQESEVKSLLEKIQPEMITLDPTFVGNFDKATKEVQEAERKLEWESNHPTDKFSPKFRARGRSSSMRRYLRKQGNVVDEKREALREKLEQERLDRERKRKQREESEGDQPRTALDRFAKKQRRE